MLEYIYFVKCPGCEDEHFFFFNDAKECAMSQLTKKPIITQVEVNRNDFGECTDSVDLGTVWSWEDLMKETDAEPAKCIFTRDDLECTDYDAEFDALDNSVQPAEARKPVPDEMTIKDLVEAMEENEDTVECAGCEELFPKDECFYDEERGWLCSDCEDRVVKCTWCDELYDRSDCRKEVDLGWLCDHCQAAIKSRGEPLTFKENSYWDFLDESTELTEGYANLANLPDAKELIIFELAKDSAIGKYLDLNNVSIKPTVTKINGSFEPVGHVIDFEFINGNIQVSLQRLNGKVNVVDIDKLISAGFFAKPMQRSCPAYELLSAIKKVASALNKAHAPTRAQRAAAKSAVNDEAVLAMLKSNTAAADELRDHITKIEFRIPLSDDYEFVLDDTDESYEAACHKIAKIQEKFNALPFAQDAINKGLVVDREITDTTRAWHIDKRWQPIGIIHFDCVIGDLTLSKDIIEDSKVIGMINGKQADLTQATQASCYRLAVALITYFDNDVEFYKIKNNSSAASAITEAMDPHDLVELEYPSLTVTLYGSKRDVDDWDEVEHTDSHVFLVPKVEVATAIWENWITEDDVKGVEGGLEVLEDDAAWEAFLETHFDVLFEKYNKQILGYFEDEATEDFRERSQEEYNMNNWSSAADRAYDEWRDEKYFGEEVQKSGSKPFLEELEDADAYRDHLTDCPECGADKSFDHETGICINCGFNI